MKKYYFENSEAKFALNFKSYYNIHMLKIQLNDCGIQYEKFEDF